MQKELWFLGAAFSFNEIYSPMKFQMCTYNTVGAMVPTRIKYEK